MNTREIQWLHMKLIVQIKADKCRGLLISSDRCSPHSHVQMDQHPRDREPSGVYHFTHGEGGQTEKWGLLMCLNETKYQITFGRRNVSSVRNFIQLTHWIWETLWKKQKQKLGIALCISPILENWRIRPEKKIRSVVSRLKHANDLHIKLPFNYHNHFCKQCCTVPINTMH